MMKFILERQQHWILQSQGVTEGDILPFTRDNYVMNTSEM